MESFTNYKLPEFPIPDLFIAPPYCRKAEKYENVVEHLHLNLVISNPSRLLLLYGTLTDNSSKALEVKINSYLMGEGECKIAFLLHLCSYSETAYVQTIGTTELETTKRFPLSENIILQLIKQENYILTLDENLFPEISALFKQMFENLSYKICAVPILKKGKYYPCATDNAQPMFLVCFVESKKNEDYLARLATEMFKYCLPVLANRLEAEEESKKRRQYQSLLTALRKLLQHIKDPNELVKHIMDETRKLTNAKNSALYLSDANQIDLLAKDYRNVALSRTKPFVKVVKNHIIAESCTSTGKLLNIQRNSTISKKFVGALRPETSNILCFPVRNENDIVGALKLCNKRGSNFNRTDEEIVTTISVFYGALLTHSLKYAESENIRIRNNLCNELMTSQISVDETLVQNSLTCPLIHLYNDFDKFTFNARNVVEKETVCFVVKMLNDLGFFKIFSINKKKFIRFITYIKCGCRDKPYHNWMHLFSVAHFSHLLLKQLKFVEQGFFTHLEALAYFITCLCHDVDYRGRNDLLEHETNSAWATLYSSSSSVMERHRLSQALRILTRENCNFLDVLDRKLYTVVLKLIKDLCLATDLSTYYKFYRKQCEMMKSGYDSNNAEHRYLFICLLVTCADVSDYTNEWSIAKEAALKMYEEYSAHNSIQDIAKTKGDDYFPNLQIEFLRQVCLPSFKLLSKTFAPLTEIVQRVKQNILNWECSKYVFQRGYGKGLSTIEILTHEEFDKAIEAAVKQLENKK